MTKKNKILIEILGSNANHHRIENQFERNRDANALGSLCPNFSAPGISINRRLGCITIWLCSALVIGSVSRSSENDRVLPRVDKRGIARKREREKVKMDYSLGRRITDFPSLFLSLSSFVFASLISWFSWFVSLSSNQDVGFVNERLASPRAPSLLPCRGGSRTGS